MQRWVHDKIVYSGQYLTWALVHVRSGNKARAAKNIAMAIEDLNKVYSELVESSKVSDEAS